MNKHRSELFAEVSEARRKIMRGIKSTETRPEKTVRALLHLEGYRFRKNVRALPGSPDVAFSKKKKAVFVHGCFWHSHRNCSNSKTPGTRTEYWRKKLQRNADRDSESLDELRSKGWKAAVVWECELGDLRQVSARLKAFLGSPRTITVSTRRKKARTT